MNEAPSNPYRVNMLNADHRFDDSAAYEHFMGSWSRAVGAVFLQWLAPPPDARWLDVGCGTGIFTKLILDTSAPAEVFAVDPEAAQIDYARRQPSLANFRIADGCALPFPESMFDIVVSALVMNFISDRPQALSEMRRVIRPGGVVGGYVWDFTAEASPSWPLRRALHESDIQVPSIQVLVVPASMRSGCCSRKGGSWALLLGPLRSPCDFLISRRSGSRKHPVIARLQR